MSICVMLMIRATVRLSVSVKLFGLVCLDLYVYRGEHQQQHRQADRDGVDRPSPRDIGGQEIPRLPGDQRTDDRQHQLDQGAGSSGRSNGAR